MCARTFPPMVKRKPRWGGYGYISKVRTGSRKITNGSYMSSNYETIVKIMTTDVLNNKL